MPCGSVICRFRHMQVDSLLSACGVMFLFQMTVGGSKPVDFAALEQLLRELGLAPQQETRLIFVVPEDVYPDFKLSVAPATRRSSKAPAPAPAPAPSPAPALAPRPKLYIMRVQRVKLGLRALAAHGGRHMAGAHARRAAVVGQQPA